jgi:hypothetical protein
MKPRSAILGIVALTLVLALRERFVAPHGARSDRPESAPAAARTPPPATLQSGKDAVPMALGTSAATASPGRPLFRETLAALLGSADTDNWAPTLDRLADSVPVGELGSAVVELAGAASESPRAMLRERLLARWTRLAPEAAAAWAAGIPGAAERGETLLQVAVGWAQSDWPGAAAWARSLSDDKTRDQLLRQLAHESLREEPLRALELAVELPGGGPRDELLVQAVGSWALRNPQDASAWVKSLSAEPGRARALESVVVNWAATDPIAAAKFALDNLSSGQNLDRAVIAVVQRWAQSAPSAAAEWVERFEPGALQRAATENLMANWFAADARGPTDWLESLQPGTLRDNSIACYARQLASIDEPALATQWLSQVDNDDLRRRTEEIVAAFTPGSTRN